MQTSYLFKEEKGNDKMRTHSLAHKNIFEDIIENRGKNWIAVEINVIECLFSWNKSCFVKFRTYSSFGMKCN